MSDTTIDRARALLSLREKATPVDGAVFREYDHGGGRLFVEAPQRRLIIDVYHEGDRSFFFSAHKMADTIAELLAEVERLSGRLRELAEAEPVAWMTDHKFVCDNGITKSPGTASDWKLEGWRVIELIRRPEMPS